MTTWMWEKCSSVERNALIAHGRGDEVMIRSGQSYRKVPRKIRKHYVEEQNPKHGIGAIVNVMRWHILGMYQKDFAKLLGISQEGVSALENGKYDPNSELLEKIHKLYLREYRKALHLARKKERVGGKNC